MEGEQARLIGARGGTSTEKVCSREERKRRKKSGGVEEVPAGLQKHPDCSSASSISHGSHLWPIVTVLDYRLPAVKDEAEITWREMMVAEVFWMCALTPLFTRCCMVSAGMIYVQLCDDLIRFLQCSHEKGNAKELAPLSDYTFYRSWCQVSCLHLFQAGSCLKEAFFSNDNDNNAICPHIRRRPQLGQRPGCGRSADISRAENADARRWNPASEDGSGWRPEETQHFWGAPSSCFCCCWQESTGGQRWAKIYCHIYKPVEGFQVCRYIKCFNPSACCTREDIDFFIDCTWCAWFSHSSSGAFARMGLYY